MKPTDHRERRLEVEGWPVRVISYRLGDEYVCVADNVSPGANLARARDTTREGAERQALETAGRKLARTRRRGG